MTSSPQSGAIAIGHNTVVTADYRLADETGEALDDSYRSGPMRYLHGHRQILPALERALDGARAGDTLTIELAPEEAYGPRQQNLVFEANRSALPADLDLHPGQRLRSGSHGRQFSLRVVQLTEQGAILDGNHPLAGKRLKFSIDIREVRAATEQEASNGQPAGT
ncbi:MAG: peptidylprolyl isomerase [Ectothiorhodospiraceae bacterium]|nr:peptidylprolyl isomerase [Ectothiorhodospiraceae bacterium]MCH8503354.1 peptidylprolyl isomerase [Ectothiorhodospiraceae bacterium]